MAHGQPATVTVQELARQRSAGQRPCVLDVRENWEVALCPFPDCVHIPLQQIPVRLKELDAHSEIIVVCKVGGRSYQAATFLLQQGFSKVANLEGGLNAWRDAIDPELPDY